MTRDHWEEEGSLDIRARAREQYKKIRDTHQPKPLEPEVQKKLQEIVEKAEA
jgi:trimethylamine:corrinoid methyltransferase-like protein